MQNTIKTRKDFLKIRDTGFKVSTRTTTVQFLLQDREGVREASSLFRYGLIVTKKMGNAVQRNLMKRQLRSCISMAEKQEKFNKVPLDKVCSFVLLPRRIFGEASFNIIFEDFTYAVQKFLKTTKI